MRLLLDTQVLLWWLSKDPALGATAREMISSPESEVYVSAATGWEISLLRSAGKLQTPDDLLDQLDRHRFEALPITMLHAVAAASLPMHHRDPFDRMLVAQAQLESLALVTRDIWMRNYGVVILEA